MTFTLLRLAGVPEVVAITVAVLRRLRGRGQRQHRRDPGKERHCGEAQRLHASSPPDTAASRNAASARFLRVT